MNGLSGNLNGTYRSYESYKSHLDASMDFPGGESVLSELMQYIARIALLIAILLAWSVVVYLVRKFRGKKYIEYANLKSRISNRIFLCDSRFRTDRRTPAGSPGRLHRIQSRAKSRPNTSCEPKRRRRLDCQPMGQARHLAGLSPGRGG